MLKKRKESVDLVPQYWSWSPESMIEDMERLFADLRSGFMYPARVLSSGEGSRMPMLDVKEEVDRFLVMAELPGMAKEDVSVEMGDDTLRISACKEQEIEEKEEGYLRKERGSMRFFRQVRLPENVDREKVKAKMENGVLEISLPKTQLIGESKNRIEIE